MYFTINELNLLIMRRALAKAQEQLASVRRNQGDTASAEYEVKRLLDRCWLWQQQVANTNANRAADKLAMLARLS